MLTVAAEPELMAMTAMPPSNFLKAAVLTPLRRSSQPARRRAGRTVTNPQTPTDVWLPVRTGAVVDLDNLFVGVAGEKTREAELLSVLAKM